MKPTVRLPVLASVAAALAFLSTATFAAEQEQKRKRARSGTLIDGSAG